jgi:hypothetical protein
MRRPARRLVGWRALLLTAWAVVGLGRPAAAQFFGGMGGVGSSSGTGASGMYANPYAMPMMNSFLNPYASLYAPANPQNAALYFLAAQSSSGGIGSGQISGSRPLPGAQAAAPAPHARRVSDSPGAGAARYFNRTVKGGNVPNGHYNRYGNYYSANGH